MAVQGARPQLQMLSRARSSQPSLSATVAEGQSFAGCEPCRRLGGKHFISDVLMHLAIAVYEFPNMPTPWSTCKLDRKMQVLDEWFESFVALMFFYLGVLMVFAPKPQLVSTRGLSAALSSLSLSLDSGRFYPALLHFGWLPKLRGHPSRRSLDFFCEVRYLGRTSCLRGLQHLNQSKTQGDRGDAKLKPRSLPA